MIVFMFGTGDDYEKWLLENPDFEDEFDYVPKTVLMTVYDSTGNGVDCDDCGYTPAEAALENCSEFFVQGMSDVKKFLATETSVATDEVKG